MKPKENKVNLYYLNQESKQRETIDEMMQRKKAKEREKRIKQNKQQNKEDDFDLETEMVIGMTNRNNQKKEEIKKKVISKQEKIKAKKRKRIKRIIKWTTLLLIIGGGTAFALTSPIFNIQEIQVTQNNRVSAETITSLSGLNSDMNIFRFFSSNIEKQIKENPYVEDVKIKRILPNKIQIEVTERIPKFCVQVLNSLAYINSQGYILEIAQNELALPIITGIQTVEENIKEGYRLEEEDLIRLGDVLKIMGAAKENELHTKVTSIDITKKNDYKITMQEEKKTIYLGDTSNLSAKMINIQGILNDNQGIEGDIYVNGDFNKKFRPYFRERILP